MALSKERRNEIAHLVILAHLRDKEVKLGGINEWAKKTAPRVGLEPSEMREFAVDLINEVTAESLKEFPDPEPLVDHGDGHLV